MDISEDRKADAVILTLSGKLDATAAKNFEEKILAVIDAGAQRLVVDHCEISSLNLRPPRRRRTQTSERSDSMIY